MSDHGPNRLRDALPAYSTERTTTLAPFLANPTEAKRDGTLPLRPPPLPGSKVRR